MSYPPQPPGSPAANPGWGYQGYHGQNHGYGQNHEQWLRVSPMPPPPPPSSQPRPRMRTGVVVTVLGLALLLMSATTGFAVFFAMRGGVIAAGDCVALEDERGGVLTEARCGSAHSDYEVVSIVDSGDTKSCPHNFGNVWGEQAYCMVLDVKPGDCLTAFTRDPGVLPIKDDCGEDAPDRVTKVEPSVAVESVCAPGELYYVFVRPARTICLGKIQNV